MMTKKKKMTGTCTAMGIGALVLVISLLAAGVVGQERPDLARPLRICAETGIDPEARILIASDNENVIAFSDVANGLNAYSLTPLRNLWATQPGGAIRGISAGAGEVRVLADDGAGTLTIRSYSAETGIVRKIVRLKAMPDAVELNGPGAVVRTESGIVVLPDAFGDSTVEIRGAFRRVLRTSGLTAASDQAGITVFDDSGRAVASIPGTMVDPIAFSADRTALYSAAPSGELRVIDLTGTRLRWKYRTGGAVTSVTEFGNMLLVGSADNFVYNFDRRNGSLLWKTRLSDRVLRAPVLAGGAFHIVNLIRNSVETRDLATGRLLSVFENPSDRAILGVARSGERLAVVTSARIFEIAADCGK